MNVIMPLCPCTGASFYTQPERRCNERMSKNFEAKKVKVAEISEKLKNAREDLSIMHPLPRVNEIATSVDDDPRAHYFLQVKNGRFIRMALILKLLKEAENEH